MSFFSYNGVVIDRVLTQSVQSEAVYDPSNTDYLYTRWTIIVQGYVTRMPDKFRETTETSDLLSQPRKVLLYDTGFGMVEFAVGPVAQPQFIARNPTGINVWSVKADAANGPIPRVHQITRVVGERSCFVSFQVVACVSPCDPGPPNSTQAVQKYILSHRWTEEEFRDLDQVSRRTRTGQILLRSRQGLPPLPDTDYYRQLAAPILPSGWVRKSARYSIQEDGLGCSYTIEDEEAHRTPPPGAISAEGFYAESVPFPAANRVFRCELSLVGPLGGKPSELVTLGLGLAWRRVRDGIGGAGLFVPLEFSVRQDLFRNRITCAISGRFAKPSQPGQPIRDVAIKVPDFGLRGYDLDPANQFYWQPASPEFKLRNRDNLVLIAAIIGNACDLIGPDPAESAKRSATGQMSGSPITPPNIQVGVVPRLPDPVPLTPSSAANAAVYSSYHISVVTSTNTNTYELVPSNNGGDPIYIKCGVNTKRVAVVVTASRQGAQPVLPAPFEPTSPGGPVLLMSEIDPGQVDLLPNGLPSYTVAGTWVYGLQRPAEAEVIAAIPPWVAESLTPAQAIGGGLGGILFDQLLTQLSRGILQNSAPGLVRLG